MRNQKPSSAPGRELSFDSKLVRWAEGMEYYALAVPAKITESLGTKKAVPVVARVNGSPAFVVSLFPNGEGRHFMRIRNKICKAAKIGEGDRVRVQVTIRDRAAEVSIPKDLLSALRAEGVEKAFEELPLGKRSFILRKIDEAAKPETRAKRIQAAVEEAHRKREREADRRVF